MKDIEKTLAFWLLRIWLGTRALFTGLTKFQGEEERVIGGEADDLLDAEMLEILADGAGSVTSAADKATETVQFLSLSNYEALPEKGKMSIESFKASPFMPDFMVEPYALCLGVALIAVGLALFAGVLTRLTLFVMGLLYVSLTYGFIILEPSMGAASAGGIAYLGIHMLLIVAALLLADYNKFELLPCSKLCKLCKCNCEK
ncbi:MAG: hypothetical protein R3Y46_06415 [Opitutales bacterium]